ncbi:hypothetical protein [Pseudomonas piscis]|uniref:hypothetical protein n=1 Tax=Pseudomonas piscis TaxID=2614538 RepID=UPI0003B415E1|nr:hypothetical protein [Pseudomonas piscis]ERO64475.1 hypothetical protein P308_23955 [Pseudomonas piscis]
MLTVIGFLFGAWVVWGYLRRRSSPTSLVVFTPRKRWALTLAQPMVDATGMTGFFDPETTYFADQARDTLRLRCSTRSAFAATPATMKFATTLTPPWNASGFVSTCMA